MLFFEVLRLWSNQIKIRRFCKAVSAHGVFMGGLLHVALVPVPLEAPSGSQLSTVPQKLIPSAHKVHRQLCYIV